MRLILSIAFVLLTLNSSAQRMSLDECITYAVKNHPAIKNAKSTIEIRKEEFIISRKEALPSVSASVSQGGSLGRNIDPFSNSIITNAINFNSASLNSSVTIFNGFRQRYEQASKELLIRGATYDELALEWNTKQSVIESYYAYLLSLEAIKLKKQQIQDIETQLSGLSELVKE